MSQNSSAKTAKSAGSIEWARGMKESDMVGLDSNGKPDPNYHANGTGHARSNVDVSKEPTMMKLTKEEQDIMDGKEGEAKAKVMKTVVQFGNTFGATHLIKLAGNPHTSLYNAPPYMKSIIDILVTCADEGLKSFAPFTVNPRPYDLYNVQTTTEEMNMAFNGVSYQPQLDHVLVRLGAMDMTNNSCACYLPEVGNTPPPGTNVSWAESSAVNFGNSVLGIRSNRNASGMEIFCAIIGKAPAFGLMTDEGRKATWLIDVQTTKEPDWGVLGAAIGIKVVEDVPFIVGIGKYFNNEVTNQNLHLLKAMGASTAANGAVGLYHVENVTPDAKKHGRDTLVTINATGTYAMDYEGFINDVGAQDPEVRKQVEATLPLGKLVTPEEAAHFVATLIDGVGTGQTGQFFAIDNGWSFE